MVGSGGFTVESPAGNFNLSVSAATADVMSGFDAIEFIF